MHAPSPRGYCWTHSNIRDFHSTIRLVIYVWHTAVCYGISLIWHPLGFLLSVKQSSIPGRRGAQEAFHKGFVDLQACP